MDPKSFTEAKPGQLVKIPVLGGHDWAFVPDPLPPSWVFPHELWPLLSQAREALARLDEKGKSMGNPDLLLEPLQSREALTSSSLEGTYSNPEELLLFKLKEGDPKSDHANEKNNDPREVANYTRALKHGYQQLSKDKLPPSKRLIREMHSLLVTGVRGNKGPGEFRKKQVYIGSDRRYIPPPPGDHLDKCLDDFEHFIRNHDGTSDPLVLSYLVHYQFEAIHPFLDGNGRIGRAFLALTTYQWFNLRMPWLYMSSFFERHKDEYISKLFRVSTHGDWKTWIEFCLRGTVVQALEAMIRCNNLILVQARMLDKAEELKMPPRLKVIIRNLLIAPVFDAVQVQKWGQASMPTARADIEKLIAVGMVEHLEGMRPRLYYAPEVFKVAYLDDDTPPEEEVIALPKDDGSPSGGASPAG
jgi:Fic family protein